MRYCTDQALQQVYERPCRSTDIEIIFSNYVDFPRLSNTFGGSSHVTS